MKREPERIASHSLHAIEPLSRMSYTHKAKYITLLCLINIIFQKCFRQNIVAFLCSILYNVLCIFVCNSN